MEKENKSHVVYLCLLNLKLIVLSGIRLQIILFWTKNVVLWEFYMFEKHKGYFEHQEIHRKILLYFAAI